MPATLTLNVLGRTYDLRADDPEDDAAEVVRYVEEVISETEREHPDLNPQKLMVLAALRMGRDYVRERKHNALLRNGLKDSSRRMADRIDALLEE